MTFLLLAFLCAAFTASRWPIYHFVIWVPSTDYFRAEPTSQLNEAAELLGWENSRTPNDDFLAPEGYLWSRGRKSLVILIKAGQSPDLQRRRTPLATLVITRPEN